MVLFGCADDEQPIDEPPIDEPPIITYTLTTNADPAIGGAVLPAETTEHDAGTSVSITAEANEGYKFVNWTGDGIADLNSAITTVSMTENRTVTANFERTETWIEPTGLPILRINTDNAAPISDKENWVTMTFSLTDPNNPANNISAMSNQQIRGRGNTTWGMPKKPYRIRFRNDTSLFGLTASRNWVLLANYKDATLIANTVAFELGQRFDGPLFKNNYVHVEVVLNGEHQGSYLLTEHMRVGPGRVDIDPVTDYLVEFDRYYDEDPRFRTTNLNLPVMIKSPDFGSNIDDPRYRFVVNSINEFDAALSSSRFPNTNWKDLVDLNSFVDYIMINDIVRNGEIGMPKSVFVCNVAGIIKMSHLWDFDWALGLGENTSVDISTATTDTWMGAHFSRLFRDDVFVSRYRARWIEKYDDIRSMSAFIEEMYDKLYLSAELNSRIWYDVDYRYEIDKLKTWWNIRIDYLDSQIRR